MSFSSSLNLETLRPAVHAALRAWKTLGGTSENLLDSLLLVQESRAKVAQDGSPSSLRDATNDVLSSALDQLRNQDPKAKDADILRTRFIDKKIGLKVAKQLNMSRDHLNRRQRAAIELLTKILLGREEVLRERRVKVLEEGLPAPTYTRLFGFEEASTTLTRKLLESQAHFLVAIIGIGGIGKTALADAVTRQIIKSFHFDEVVWLRVQGHGMNAPNLTLEGLWASLAERLWAGEGTGDSPRQRVVRLRQALKAKPHLVVIDNLEAEADIAYLLPYLGDFANPSKFLLTTRTRPVGYSVYSYSLGELSPQDAATLLRHHATTIGLYGLAEASDAESEAIYQVTGGNPLALKIVVSLAAVLPLPQILADLKRSPSGQIEKMYRHIYWKAWQILSPQARNLLQATPLISETGALPEQMAAISGLTQAHLWTAITELVSRSLLEVQGTPWQRRYGIHRLTESFLDTEIIRWDTGRAADAPDVAY